jgi:hypothetical protein
MCTNSSLVEIASWCSMFYINSRIICYLLCVVEIGLSPLGSSTCFSLSQFMLFNNLCFIFSDYGIVIYWKAHPTRTQVQHMPLYSDQVLLPMNLSTYSCLDNWLGCSCGDFPSSIVCFNTVSPVSPKGGSCAVKSGSVKVRACCIIF